MRPGQHNKRGRSRNRRHSVGGGGATGGGGGNPLSRIYESNGPDVKVRGTAQTVAEKYLQLGRDAQASGDIVMAESYYQYAEHYLRIVAAAHAYQQQMQPQFRRPGEEFDDDGEEDGTEGDGEEGQAPAEAAIPPGLSDQPDASAPQIGPEGERQPQNFRPREQQGGRERFRPRWQDRRERQPHGDQPREASPPRPDEQKREPEAGNGSGGETQGGLQWEAPSFLRRPAPLPAAEAGEEQPQRRPRPERRPRRDGEAAEEAAAPETPPPVD
ncbi:MAG: DUF4167 domain-containing protein [Hyphomicrobiales bacterium]